MRPMAVTNRRAAPLAAGEVYHLVTNGLIPTLKLNVSTKLRGRHRMLDTHKTTQA
jgi:hypothetical protein